MTILARIGSSSGVPWGLLILTAILLAGCTRHQYRLAADHDAYALIESKACHPEWPLDDYRIDVDPLSRMYDSGRPDRPPMPPDDPTAHKLMHCIDCKKGYPCWHANGDTNIVENPDWIASLPRNGNGVVWLDTESAMRVALLHSPNYQKELEDLYLSALDVSFERFRFDTQFFGGYDTTFAADARNRSVFGGDSSSDLSIGRGPSGTALRGNKLFATGGELVVGLANSLMWQFSGPNTHSATTFLDFSLIQPLLRAGGRDVVLERLTIAERALLSNVRQMERFRRGFYVEVVTGQNSGPGPKRRGGFFGGSGLDGFSGVGAGGFGRVGGSLGLASGAGAAQAGGFLGLLQDQQDLRNQSGNITALRNSVAQLQAFYLAGRIDFFQVELARQALFNAQSRLLNAEAAFQTGLDRFKADLGLPPQLELQLDERLIAKFQIIDPLATELQNEMTSIQERVGETISDWLAVHESEDADPSENVAPTGGRLRERLAEGLALSDRTSRELVPRIREDIKQLREALPGRQADVERIRRLAKGVDSSSATCQSTTDGEGPPSDGLSTAMPVGSGLAEALPLDPDRLAQLPQQLEKSLRESQRRIKQFHTQLAKLRDAASEPTKRDATEREPSESTADEARPWMDISEVLSDLSAEILSLTLMQARARSETVRLIPVELPWHAAVELARGHRRDWMNARSQLVDVWRLIQFNANALESDLNFVFSGDISNVGDNPFDVRASTGRLRVGLEFDAPMTRLAERNTYRQALIEYQQARRIYYQFEDAVARGLRNTVRSIDVNQLNFELRRAAVNLAIGQVELTRLRLLEPPRPEAAEARLGATTARDLVNALAELLNVQNDFLSVWINQEVQRRVLDFNLGTMQLDPAGIWLDPGPISAPNSAEVCQDQSDSTLGRANSEAGDRPRPVEPELLPEAIESLEQPDEIPIPSPPDTSSAPAIQPFVRPVAFWQEYPGVPINKPFRIIRRLPAAKTTDITE